MRDILAHDYLGIDLEVTWKVVQKEIPELKKKMGIIKKDLEMENR